MRIGQARKDDYVDEEVEAGNEASLKASGAPARKAKVPPRDRKPETVKRNQPKIGRNNPCPCGSGKKYKNCHGRAGTTSLPEGVEEPSLG